MTPPMIDNNNASIFSFGAACVLLGYHTLLPEYITEVNPKSLALSKIKSNNGACIEFFFYLCSGMKQSTIHKLDQIRLYIGVTGLAYTFLDLLFCHSSSLLFPASQVASYIASILAFILAVVLVVRHVRCYPLTQEEKEAGLWFLVRLSK